MDRRTLLRTAALGFGNVALMGLASSRSSDASEQAAATFQGTPKAKRVIFLFMHGGPSQVDTFDYKPELQRRHGQNAIFSETRTGEMEPQQLLGSPWSFRRFGQCGQYVSELFPNLADHVDKLCFIHSMRTEGTAHGQATLFMHTGNANLVRPSIGSWVCYGLGSECENLPGFVTIAPNANIGGVRTYSNAFLPANTQATVLGRAEHPVTEATFANTSIPQRLTSVRNRQAELLQKLNGTQLQRAGTNPALEALIQSYEMAFRMQSTAPQLTQLDQETESTLRMYGIGQKETDDFGRQCLLARRLSESGVRFVQVNYSDNTTTPRWDQHRNLKDDHEIHAKAVDQPISALLTDLQQRGLLEDTLVWWCGEFGRTPYSQNVSGRDHNPFGFTTWLAGGGVKPGFAYGSTDELGMAAVKDRIHTHDLHATILHLLGIKHLHLTYRYAGRDFRLTDVAGEVVKEILI